MLGDLPDAVIANSGSDNDLNNGNDLMGLEPFDSGNDNLIQQNGPTSLSASLSKGGAVNAGSDLMRSPRPNAGNMQQNLPPNGPISTAGMATPPTPMLNQIRNSQLSVGGNIAASNATSHTNTSMVNSSFTNNISTMNNIVNANSPMVNSSYNNNVSSMNNSNPQFNNNMMSSSSLPNNSGTFNSPASLASSMNQPFNPMSSVASMAYSNNFNQSMTSTMPTSNALFSNTINNMNNTPNNMMSSNSLFNGQMSSPMNVIGQNMMGNRGQNFNGNPGMMMNNRMYNNPMQYRMGGPKNMGNFPMNFGQNMINPIIDGNQDGMNMNMNRMVCICSLLNCDSSRNFAFYSMLHFFI